jgi:hypothetical protein
MNDALMELRELIRGDIRNDIQVLRDELRQDTQQLRGDIRAVRADIRAETQDIRNEITHIRGDNRRIYELTVRVSFPSLLFKRLSDLFARLSTPDAAMGPFGNTKSCHFLINSTGNNPPVM